MAHIFLLLNDGNPQLTINKGEVHEAKFIPLSFLYKQDYFLYDY
jgi:hypothetical protein